MTAITQRMTLEEFLNDGNGTENLYELVAGERVEMPPESTRNIQITFFLIAQFLQFLPAKRLTNKTEIVIAGAPSTIRVPDLIVLSEDLEVALQGRPRSTIMLDMPPPLLVVEVASPGKRNQDRDYRYKRSEYAVRGIIEYWIIDPEQEQVTVLTLVEGFYEEAVLRGGDRVRSQILDALDLTAEQILRTEID
jgi:Uma2 family endonuclease